MGRLISREEMMRELFGIKKERKSITRDEVIMITKAICRGVEIELDHYRKVTWEVNEEYVEFFIFATDYDYYKIRLDVKKLIEKDYQIKVAVDVIKMQLTKEDVEFYEAPRFERIMVDLLEHYENNDYDYESEFIVHNGELILNNETVLCFEDVETFKLEEGEDGIFVNALIDGENHVIDILENECSVYDNETLELIVTI